MFFTVYKTTNKINNKIYIGTHITQKPDDDYFGSGTILKRAIKKHGIENFEKEVLFIYDNLSDMFNKEAELVNEDFLKREDVYNVKLGGSGGWDYVQNMPDFISKIWQTKGGNVVGSTLGKLMVEKQLGIHDPTKQKEYRTKSSQTLKGRKPTFKDKKHSSVTIEQMKLSHKGKHTGNKNSQYGTIWITNGDKNLKIKKEELDKYNELGYVQGRKIK